MRAEAVDAALVQNKDAVGVLHAGNALGNDDLRRVRDLLAQRLANAARPSRYRRRSWNRRGSGSSAFSAGRGRCTGAASARRRRSCRPARCRFHSPAAWLRIKSSAQARRQTRLALLLAWRPRCPSGGFPGSCRRTARSSAARPRPRRAASSRSYSRTSCPPTRTLPSDDIVQAGDQVDEARLRAARAAEDADGLPGLDVQVDVLQDGLAACPAGRRS